MKDKKTTIEALKREHNVREDTLGFLVFDAADIYNSDPRVSEASVLYEDGFVTEARALASELSPIEQLMFEDDCNRFDHKQRIKAADLAEHLAHVEWLNSDYHGSFESFTRREAGAYFDNAGLAIEGKILARAESDWT